MFGLIFERVLEFNESLVFECVFKFLQVSVESKKIK
jgi:hypothetical protein